MHVCVWCAVLWPQISFQCIFHYAYWEIFRLEINRPQCKREAYENKIEKNEWYTKYNRRKCTGNKTLELEAKRKKNEKNECRKENKTHHTFEFVHFGAKIMKFFFSEILLRNGIFNVKSIKKFFLVFLLKTVLKCDISIMRNKFFYFVWWASFKWYYEQAIFPLLILLLLLLCPFSYNTRAYIWRIWRYIQNEMLYFQFYFQFYHMHRHFFFNFFSIIRIINLLMKILWEIFLSKF